MKSNGGGLVVFTSLVPGLQCPFFHDNLRETQLTAYCRSLEFQVEQLKHEREELVQMLIKQECLMLSKECEQSGVDGSIQSVIEIKRESESGDICSDKRSSEILENEGQREKPSKKFKKPTPNLALKLVVGGYLCFFCKCTSSCRWYNVAAHTGKKCCQKCYAYHKRRNIKITPNRPAAIRTVGEVKCFFCNSFETAFIECLGVYKWHNVKEHPGEKMCKKCHTKQYGEKKGNRK
eukprot:TRINITY_DN1626_c0_g1_i2.p1 TRINITY_DN1626_c0_g1~~TRINITY_DN1626_c0_g1_i2.p1  ORF type:complete len:235 (+),score=19.93 TRINITY_DN1626_c0_g1_i2:108-812(+)